MSKKKIYYFFIVFLVSFSIGITSINTVLADNEECTYVPPDAEDRCPENYYVCSICSYPGYDVKHYYRHEANSDQTPINDKDEGEHYRDCRYCGKNIYSSHTIDTTKSATYIDNSKHESRCAECGGSMQGEHIITTYDKKDDTGHTGECTLCKEDITASHDTYGGYVGPCDDTYHYVACYECNYDKIKKEHTQGKLDKNKSDKDYHYYKCSFTNCTGYIKKPHTSMGTATNYNDTQHEIKCNTCDYSAWFDHSFTPEALSDSDPDYYKKHKLVCVCGFDRLTEDHTNSEATQLDDEYHQYECTRCHVILQEKHDESAGVSLGGLTLSDPTNAIHKITCSKCGYEAKDDKGNPKTGAHTYNEEHACTVCGQEHDYKNENEAPNTFGQHFFGGISTPEEQNSVRAGEVSTCMICGFKLTLTGGMNMMDMLDDMPEKDDYTMVGARPPMEEKEMANGKLEFEFTTSAWPVSRDGSVLELPSFNITKYTHGSLYDHIQQHENGVDDTLNETGIDLYDVTRKIKKGEEVDKEAAKKAMHYYLTTHADYDEDYILKQMKSEVDEALKRMSNLFTGKWSKPNYMYSNNTNILYNTDWNELANVGSPLADSWIAGESSSLSWTKYVTPYSRVYDDAVPQKDSNQRVALTYYASTELGEGHYEIQDAGLLTSGFSDSVKNDRASDGNGTGKEGMNNTLLFTIGKCGGGGGDSSTDIIDPTETETPPNTGEVWANLVIGYRDTNGNMISSSPYLPPRDQVYAIKIWEGSNGSGPSDTFNHNFIIQLPWTQGAGYRAVEAYWKGMGTNDLKVPSGGRGNENPSGGTRVALTNNSLTLTISTSPENLAIGVVVYFEPVKITLQHFDNLNSNTAINTNKNVTDILCSKNDDYSLDNIHYSTKVLPSLNKALWPGYILTGYEIYDSDGVTLLASKTYDSSTTSKYNQSDTTADDVKRYAKVTTALLSSSDSYYADPPYKGDYLDIHNNEFNYDLLHKTEKLGFGQDKIVKFRYAYAIAGISHVEYENTNLVLKDTSGKDLAYDIRLDGDNMIIKSLDTTALSIYEKNAGGRPFIIDGVTYRYDLSDRALVQVWIYEKQFNADGTEGDIVLNKVIAHEKYAPTGVSNLITTDDNGFYNGTIISTAAILNGVNKTDKVWSDLVIKFVYKEVHSVNVKYVDEDGNTVIPPERVPIDPNEPTVIPVPKIPGREFKEYTIEDVEEYKNPTIEGFDPGNPDEPSDDIIKIPKGKLPDKNLEMIVVYKKVNPEDSSEDDDDEDEFLPPYAYIKSNDPDDEEYDVEKSIPTEEDLYADIRTEEYILRDYFKEIEETQKFKVQLLKYYHEYNNEDGTTETSLTNVGEPFEYDFDYTYYGGSLAQLYILKDALIHNEVLSGDADKFSGDGELILIADWINKPELVFEKGGQLTIPTGSASEDSTTGSSINYVEVRR